MNDESEQSLDDLTGPEVIRDFVKRLPGKPGVYRMFNAEGDAIYVGKARNLRNRVSNYARGQATITACLMIAHQNRNRHRRRKRKRVRKQSDQERNRV